MTQKTIKYGIAFDVDKVSLDRIQNQLQKIMNTPSSGMEKGFEKTKQTASEVYQILRQCYNQDLGSLNVEKFSAKLKQAGIGLKELQSLGPNTFNRMGMAMASANVQLNRSNTFINNIVRTMADSAKWSLAYGLINKVSQSITDAISYVKELDTSLNDIRIVTGKSEANMRSFAQEANKAAIALGSSTKAYADASLIYYQQGLGDAEAKERARITTMVANVTGQSASAASEQLTAIWNGYKVNAAEAELYIDKVAKVAAQTGADLEELSTGMSKVASAANIMGVDIDELNAQLATVITVTRQAPESVGTAFKTIYARINAIESGSEDAETTLKSYTKTMLQYGVNVLDMNGKLRDTGDVIAEIGGKWGTMTKEQQLGLAQAMAGQRQYNNLLALFDNWDMYNDALHESQTAMGTLQEQQDVYMDSIAAHAAQAKAQFESLYENLLDKGSINAFYDFTGNIAGTFDKMFSSFGGGLTSLLPVLLAIGSLFSKQIATGAYNLFSTLSKTSPVIENIRSQMALISAGAQGTTSASMEVRALATGYQAQLDVLEKMQGVRAGLSEQQQKEIVDGAARLGQLEEELALADSVMQKRAQEIGAEGGVQDVNSIISQEEITASYHSRQMGNSPEDDALGQKIQLRKQELALSEEAVNVQKQFKSLLGDENQTLQQQEYALNTITKGQKAKLQAAAKTLQIENAEKMTTQELVTTTRAKIQALKQSKQTTQEELAVLEKISAEMTETAGEFSHQRVEAEGVKNALDNTINSASKLSAVVKGTTTILSGAGTLAMSWQMISTSINAFKEAADGAISWGDAITQALMSIGMGLPMALGAIKSLNETFGITTGIIDGYNAKKLLSNQLDAASIPLIGKKVTGEQILQASGLANLVVTDKLGDKKVEAALATALENGENTKALAILKGLNAEQLKKLGLDEAQIANLGKLTAAQGAYNASAWANPYLLIGAAIVAAIAAIGVATYALVKMQDSEEKQLKRIKEAQESLNKAYTDTANQAKEMQDSLNKYKDLLNVLHQCARGTEEWAQAFKNVNQAANEILKKYPSLAKLDNLWIKDEKTGTRVLNTELIQDQITNLENGANVLEAAQLMGQAKIEQTEANAVENKITNKLSDLYYQGDGVYAQEYYTVRDLIQQGASRGDIEAAMGYQQDKADKLFEILDSWEKEKKEARTVTDNVTMSAVSQQWSTQIKEAQETTKDPTYVNAFIKQGQAQYEALYDQYYEEYKKISHKLSKGTAGDDRENENYKKLLKAYNEATGQQYQAATTQNAVLGSDANRRYVFSKDGKNETIGEEHILATIAASKALEALGQSAKSAAAKLQDIKEYDEGSGSGNALIGYIGEGNFENVAAKDYEALLTAVFGAEGKPADMSSTEAIEKITAYLEEKDYTDENVGDTFHGFESLADVAKDMAHEMELSVGYTGEGLSASVKKAFDQAFETGLNKELTYKQGKKIGDALQKIFNELGQEGLTAVEELINVGGEDLMLAVADFNFSTGDLEDFIALLEKSGITISEDNLPAIKNWYNALADSETQIEVSAAALQKASELIRGSTISAEEYKEYATFAKDYFAQMHDGTYMLIEDAEAFYNLVKEQRQQYYLDKIEASQDMIDRITEVGDMVSSVEEAKSALKAMLAAGKIDESAYQEHLIALDNNPEQGIKDINTIWEDFDKNAAVSSAEDAMVSYRESIASTATSVAELNELWTEGKITEEEYAKAKKALRAKELKDLGISEAELKNYIALRQKEIGTAEQLGLTQEEYNALLEDEYIAKQKLQKAFKDIEDNFPDLYETLTSDSSTNSEKAKAASTLQETMQSAFGVEVDTDFFFGEEGQTNLNLFKAAIEGNVTALQKLKLAATKNQIQIDPKINPKSKDKIYAFIDDIVNTPLEVGDEIDITKVQEVYRLLRDEAQWSAEQIEAYFNNLDISIEYETKTDTQTFDPMGKTLAEQSRWRAGKENAGYDVQWDGEKYVATKKWQTIKGANKIQGTTPYKPSGDKDKDKDTKDPKDTYDLDEEIDKYYEVNRELKKLQKAREKLSKQTEHLVGQDLIDNLTKQNALLEKENGQIRKKIDLLRTEAAELKKILQTRYAIQFSEEGDITNYSTVLEEHLNKINDIITRLNAAEAAGDEALVKKLQKELDEAEKVYKRLKELISRYDEIVYDEIPTLEIELDENADDIIDNNIKKFNAKIEVEIDLHEFDQKMREFERTMNFKEGAFGSIVGIAQSKLEELGAMIGDGGILQKLTDHVNNLAGPLGEGTYQTHTKDYLDDLKEYATELIDNLEDAEELIDEIREAMVELMEEASEAFDTQISRYEALQATLEHDIALLGLLDGEENNYAAKQAFYDKQNENYIAQLAFQREQVVFWQKQMEMAEEGSEAYETAEENMREAIESSQETLEKAIESAQTAHINSIRAIFEELENQITGGKGLDQLTKEWELIRENADYYLDDVNKAYELSKLERNYRKAIDESDSVYAQRQINDMMSSELAMLKEKDKLTKYDIDRANLKYQLTLKQIALEDAQKNKSTMRLKRDKNGNYSYQYVADSSATAQLEQEIADLNNQIHNLDKEAYSSNLEQIRQVYQEWAKAMLEIENSGGTEEEKAEKRLAINKLYTERLQQLMTENQWMLMNLEQATIDSITGTWGNGVQDMVNAIQGEGGLEPVMNRVMSQITEATVAYQNTVTSMCEAAGKSLEELYGGFDKNIDILGDLITKNDGVIAKYDEELGRMQLVLDTLEDMLIKYGEVRQAAIDAANAAYAQYQAVANAALQGTNTGNGDKTGNLPDLDWAQQWAKEIVDGSSKYSIDEIIKNRQTKIDKTPGYSGYNNDKINKILDAYGSKIVPTGVNWEQFEKWIKDIANGKAFFTDDWQKYYIGTKADGKTYFNTGGYTGAWANGDHDGRLAFLHQKELVLNSADTANLLKAIDVVRSLDMSLMSRMAGMLGQIGLRSLGAHTPESAPIEQNVHIDAHFPNVSSAQEIQEAFDQLADQLGQILYQNRK